MSLHDDIAANMSADELLIHFGGGHPLIEEIQSLAARSGFRLGQIDDGTFFFCRTRTAEERELDERLNPRIGSTEITDALSRRRRR